MANISVLKEDFDKLPMSMENYPLYTNLLELDISDFKPLMEALLDNRLDIEDTRPIFSPYMNFQWSKGDRLKDPRIAVENEGYLADAALARLNGDDSKIIKENIAFPSTDVLKNMIAEEYFRREGVQLPPEDVAKLIPIIQDELVIELSMYNNNAVKDKEYQLLLADLMSIKPKNEI